MLVFAYFDGLKNIQFLLVFSALFLLAYFLPRDNTDGRFARGTRRSFYVPGCRRDARANASLLTWRHVSRVWCDVSEVPGAWKRSRAGSDNTFRRRHRCAAVARGRSPPPDDRPAFGVQRSTQSVYVSIATGHTQTARCK